MNSGMKVLNAVSSCSRIDFMSVEIKMPSADLLNSICGSKSINLEG